MHAATQPSSHFLKSIALLFGAAAVFHLWRVFSPDPTDPSGPIRHGVFVAINLAVGACLWLRPGLLRVVLGLLVIQQVSSHGTTAWQAWFQHQHIDIVSIAIVVVMPVTWIVLWRTRS